MIIALLSGVCLYLLATLAIVAWLSPVPGGLSEMLQLPAHFFICMMSGKGEKAQKVFEK